jgi:hypothetical protein
MTSEEVPNLLALGKISFAESTKKFLLCNDSAFRSFSDVMITPENYTALIGLE